MFQQKLIYSIVQVRVNHKTRGSGFLLSGGFIVTAYHVVEKESPGFFICNDQACFEEEVLIKPEAIVKLSREEGDLLIYEIENANQYESRYLELAPEKEILHGKRFQTFGFPNGNSKNGNPYNRAILDDTFSANDFGIRKLTLADPGNISKGYSGAPVYVPGYGVIGIITQKWEEISIGLPASEIVEKTPGLSFRERFFPEESIGKYRCLLVHNHGASKAINFFESEVEYAFSLDSTLKAHLHLEKFHIENEVVDLQIAVGEADCVCLWIDNNLDVIAYLKYPWLKDHTLLVFNHGLEDLPRVKTLLNALGAPFCFPLHDPGYSKFPGDYFHCFKRIETIPNSYASEAYRSFFEFLKTEYLFYKKKFRNLLLGFDYNKAKADIEDACLQKAVFFFYFHCLEGSPNCGLEVLVRHGKEIISRKREPDSSPPAPVKVITLDWEHNAPNSLNDLLVALELDQEKWFSHNGKQLIVFKNLIIPGLAASIIDSRIQLINELIAHCDQLNGSTDWTGSYHFFLLNTDGEQIDLSAKLLLAAKCHISSARVRSLSIDHTPIDEWRSDLDNPVKVPARLRQAIQAELPETEKACQHVGSFLLDLCQRLDAENIYFNELTDYE